LKTWIYTELNGLILLFYVTGWVQEHTVYSTNWQKSRWRKHTGWQFRTYGKQIELFWKFKMAATVGNSLSTGMYGKKFEKHSLRNYKLNWTETLKDNCIINRSSIYWPMWISSFNDVKKKSLQFIHFLCHLISISTKIKCKKKQFLSFVLKCLFEAKALEILLVECHTVSNIHW